MKAGTTVRLIQPVIQGQVMERRINPSTDELEVLVSYTADGAETSRWFAADQLEAVEAAGGAA